MFIKLQNQQGVHIEAELVLAIVDIEVDIEVAIEVIEEEEALQDSSKEATR